VDLDNRSGHKFNFPEAGISKNYCARNSGLPEVELRFCPSHILIWSTLGTGQLLELVGPT